MASAPATADTAASKGDTGHQFVVVTFANDPYRPAPRAGTTGRRYAGGTYGLAQAAHNNAQRVAATYSLRQVVSWPIKALGVHCVVYEIPDSRSVAEVLTTLTKDPRVTLAQPLQEFHTLTSDTAYNDPLYGLQTNLVALDISAAHQRSQGAGIKVALIDTGVDRAHPDLRERISGTRSFVTTNFLTPTAAGPTPPTAASYRHGTAMAGLIAAVANNKLGIVGIAPLARIEVFEACWQLKPNSDAAVCNTFTLAQALAAALEARIPLINLSIAGPADPLLSALVRSGLKRGVIFVGSATEAGDAFPTNINGVIGVANSDGLQTNPAQQTPEQHNPGQRNQPAATLAAPASHVLTLRPDAQYDFESGSSVAAAEMTGVVALLLSANNRLTADSIVSLLRSSAEGAKQAAAIDVDAALAKVEAAKGAGRLARSATH
ncbi:MAG: S8 family serine peptidase [Steroidobacteraceae bacterium]